MSAYQFKCIKLLNWHFVYMYEVFLEAHFETSHLLGVVSSDISDMPRLIHISREVLLALGISDDKPVQMTVLLQPDPFGGILE